MPFEMRLFPDREAVRHVGEGLLARTLPKAEWTHEAHIAATIYILREREDIDLPQEMPGIIQRYNLSVGTENTDTGGYHETLTRLYLGLLQAYVAETRADDDLDGVVNRFLQSPAADRQYMLNFYSKARIFSVEARRTFVAPDRAPVPWTDSGKGARPTKGYSASAG